MLIVMYSVSDVDSDLLSKLSFHFTISPIMFGPLGLARQDVSPHVKQI